MPDEVHDKQSSELEQLMAEAEKSAETPVSDKPKPCDHQDIPIELKHKCPLCLWSYCELCASQLDPKFCKNCLNEVDGALQSAPLIDDEGVAHEGRVLTPDPNARFFQPRFGTLAKTISEMRDNDLDEYILYYKNLVKAAETALDFRRVVLGSAQIEQAQRADKKRRELRADKTKYPVKTITIEKNGKKTKTASLADLAKMLEALKQIDINRKKKAEEAKKTEGGAQ